MSELDRQYSPDNPQQWEIEAAFEQETTPAQQMTRFFPGKTAEEIANANPYDLLLEVAFARRCDGVEDEDDPSELDWDVMMAIWQHARDVADEAKMIEGGFDEHVG